MTEQAVAVREVDALPAWNPQQVVAQVALVQSIMRDVMKSGEHFGVIPGTQKPTLLKPGAEKLGLTFRLAPTFIVERTDLPAGHREYQVACRLTSIVTGAIIADGVGLCSTMETKYRYREAHRTCPTCGKDTIIKGKAEYGGGWVCFKKRGGCGAKWPDGAAVIEGQPAGRTEHPDIADTYNTVLKMGKKRAFVDAMITATGASDIFTQDLEEEERPATEEPAPAPAAPSASSGDGTGFPGHVIPPAVPPPNAPPPYPRGDAWVRIREWREAKGKSQGDVLAVLKRTFPEAKKAADLDTLQVQTLLMVVRQEWP